MLPIGVEQKFKIDLQTFINKIQQKFEPPAVVKSYIKFSSFNPIC